MYNLSNDIYNYYIYYISILLRNRNFTNHREYSIIYSLQIFDQNCAKITWFSHLREQTDSRPRENESAFPCLLVFHPTCVIQRSIYETRAWFSTPEEAYADRCSDEKISVRERPIRHLADLLLPRRVETTCLMSR